MFFSAEENAEILREYEIALNNYPEKKAQVEAYLQDKPEDFSVCMKSIYGHLHTNDLISEKPALFERYITPALSAFENISYVRDVSTEIFLSYVLPPRVNNEWLDGSREFLQEALLPYINPNNIVESVLAVNLWCFGKATYMPSNERTLAPYGVMRAGVGRCGEESTFAVCALRSVGIPARQVYVPRWSHCDDNHAWVEVWIKDSWHYLGACEPSNALDRGWFTAAASKAMLIFAKRWNSSGSEKALVYEEGQALVANTKMYTVTQLLRVFVTENGTPVTKCKVRFQIVNFSELFTLYETETDATGYAEFETAMGDICVSVFTKDKYLLQKVDMRNEQNICIDLGRASFYPELNNTALFLDLVPAAEKTDITEPVLSEEFCIKQAEFELQRKLFTESFYRAESSDPYGKYRTYARGNREELEKFINNPLYTEYDKLLLLATLESKDFIDLQPGVLEDALINALPYKNKYAEEIYQRYILAPRVENEMLLPNRSALRMEIKESFAEAADILKWLNENTSKITVGKRTNYLPSALECIKSKKVPEHAFDYVFVAICRAFGFPSRLNPNNGIAEWQNDNGKWISVVAEENTTAEITLINSTNETLNYFEHFTISVLKNDDFQTLDYSGLVLQKEVVLKVPLGLYRVITSRRQIDGTASVIISHIIIADKSLNNRILIELPVDKTASKLKSISLLNTGNEMLDSLLSQITGKRAVLIFASPGDEPTEHLFQEMLLCSEAFNKSNIQIEIYINEKKSIANETLQRVLNQVHGVHLTDNIDGKLLSNLQRLMQTGDKRLPFVMIIDDNGRGVYASANYNIREAQTLLNIIEILESLGNCV